jgi:hypothetical protein
MSVSHNCHTVSDGTADAVTTPRPSAYCPQNQQVLTAVTMESTVVWNVMPCKSLSTFRMNARLSSEAVNMKQAESLEIKAL